MEPTYWQVMIVEVIIPEEIETAVKLRYPLPGGCCGGHSIRQEWVTPEYTSNEVKRERMI